MSVEGDEESVCSSGCYLMISHDSGLSISHNLEQPESKWIQMNSPLRLLDFVSAAKWPGSSRGGTFLSGWKNGMEGKTFSFNMFATPDWLDVFFVSVWVDQIMFFKLQIGFSLMFLWPSLGCSTHFKSFKINGFFGSQGRCGSRALGVHPACGANDGWDVPWPLLDKIRWNAGSSRMTCYDLLWLNDELILGIPSWA